MSPVRLATPAPTPRLPLPLSAANDVDTEPEALAPVAELVEKLSPGLTFSPPPPTGSPSPTPKSSPADTPR